MNLVIIEDEDRTARQLERMLKKYDESLNVQAWLPSVQEALAWFSQNPLPDLAFMDIHLEDGLAFRILEQIPLTLPVIFTTAYDEYMLKAFRANSIDYLLKPVEYEELVAALQKYKALWGRPSVPDLRPLLQWLGKPQPVPYRERFMVTIGTRIWSIETADVAYFFTEEKATFLVTREGQCLPLEFSLEQLAGMLNAAQFFRVNRQFLVSRPALRQVHAYSAGKLKVDLQPVSRQEVFVSASRISEFKDWLGR